MDASFIPTLISIGGVVVSVAIAWGKASAEADENKRWRAEMESKIKDCPNNKMCELKHSFLEQTLKKVSDEVGDIKRMLMDVLRERGGE